ncbi:MAG: 4Fe-4S binding protein [Burkholderiales bacterium]|jgi:polyferredoxin|nr:4Fe-4S binding protein [Burkholderiales bacterium]
MQETPEVQKEATIKSVAPNTASARDEDDEAQAAAKRAKKILIRREGMVRGRVPWLDRRNVRTWRHAVQAVFVLLNVYLCTQFYFWVRYYETGGESLKVARPAGVEGWLPIAGLMNLKYTLLTFKIPPIHIAAMFLLIAFLLISVLFKKSFCSWLCPVGTLSEVLWRLGQKLFGRNLPVPRWLDISLRALKYLLLAFFLWIVVTVSAEEIMAFMGSEYGLIVDVKMLDFFRYISNVVLITLIVLIVGSVFIKNSWCRYLCPYGALLGVISMVSPFKIRRDAEACIDCAKCAKACPAQLPVDTKLQIRSAECTACLSCVSVCPAKDALQLSLRPDKKTAVNGDAQGIARRWSKRALSGAMVTLLLIVVVGGIIAAAKLTGHWQTPIPEAVYKELIPNARDLGHP